MRRPPTTSLIEQLSDDADELERARGLAEEIEMALAGLRSEYREAFVLFHERQLSYAQISATMQCPLGTVKTWVHRARRELVAQLKIRGIVREPGECSAQSLKIG